LPNARFPIDQPCVYAKEEVEALVEIVNGGILLLRRTGYVDALDSARITDVALYKKFLKHSWMHTSTRRWSWNRQFHAPSTILEISHGEDENNQHSRDPTASIPDWNEQIPDAAVGFMAGCDVF
jgi:hypothetical protein